MVPRRFSMSERQRGLVKVRKTDGGRESVRKRIRDDTE